MKDIHKGDIMLEHRFYNGEYGKHIVNINKDSKETIIRYVCNLENTNKFKIIIGEKDLIEIINKEFPLDNQEKIPLANREYTVAELSERIRHRLYYLDNTVTVKEDINEILHVINSMVNVKDYEFLIGVDSVNNIETIHSTINEAFRILEVEDFTLYVYDGVDSNENIS